MTPQPVAPLELEYDASEVVEGAGRRGRVVGVSIVAIVIGSMFGLGGLALVVAGLIAVGSFNATADQTTSAFCAFIGCLIATVLVAVPMVAGGVALIRRRAWGRTLILGSSWLLLVTFGGLCLTYLVVTAEQLKYGWDFWWDMLIPIAVLGGFGWLGPAVFAVGIGRPSVGEMLRRQHVGSGRWFFDSANTVGLVLIGGAMAALAGGLFFGAVFGRDNNSPLPLFLALMLLGIGMVWGSWFVPRLGAVLLIVSALSMSGYLLYEMGLTYERSSKSPHQYVERFEPHWELGEFLASTVFIVPALVFAGRVLIRGR